MAIRMEPREVVREIKRRLADPNDDLADRVAAAKLVMRQADAERHLAPVRQDDVAKPSLPTDAPSPKIKASRKTGRKKGVYIMLDPDVLEFFQKDGPGYQTRINDYLRKAIE